MALYKDGTKLLQSTDSAFDTDLRPGATTPYSGIYRCQACGDEIAANKGNPLPPQNHHQHNPPKPIVWRLLVGAVQQK